MSIKIKTDDSHIEAAMEEEKVSLFNNKEDMIVLLKALFSHGYADLPFDIPLGVSMNERQSAVELAFQQAEITVKNNPSIIDWLHCDLFEDNECNIPLALFFIELYEQHPSSDQKDKECNFREIYHFLYKMTTNQTNPYLSHNSAKVLYQLLSELIEEVWPNTQPEFLKFLSKMHIYSRSAVRRTYSRKRTAQEKKTIKNCSP